ncbi:glycosyl transferase, partial [Bacteroidota bacterium]
LQILNGNYSVIQDFIVYQIRLFKTKDAGHGGFLLYHFVILLIGVFPASLFAIKSFKRRYFEESIQNNYKQLMAILFWCVLILFTIVKTKIVHYSSMCYFPLTFLAASVIYKIINYKEKFNTWLIISISIIGFVYATMISILPIIEKNKSFLINKGVFNDSFAIASFMADAGYSGNEFLIGIVLLIALLFVIFFRIIKNYRASFIALFLGCILFIDLTIIFITPKIEKYSQNAAIEFYKSLEKKDCYVTTLKYKSYAQYFYTNMQIPDNNNSKNRNWLLSGNIDKDAYFVVKNNKLNSILDAYEGVELLYEKNGYAFLVRKKKNYK